MNNPAFSLKGALGSQIMLPMDGYLSHSRMAYTVEEAGELLSLSRAQVFRLIDTGEIQTIKIGRSRRITSRQLEAFLKAQEQAGGFLG